MYWNSPQEPDYYVYGFNRLYLKINKKTGWWAVYYKEKSGYFNSLIQRGYYFRK